jgi:hypothetical protein
MEKMEKQSQQNSGEYLEMQNIKVLKNAHT